MSFAEDTAPFFADFGVASTLGGVAVVGVFDEEYGEAYGLVGGTSPSMLLPASVSVSRGATLTIGARSFTVVEIKPDGTGMQRLVLELP